MIKLEYGGLFGMNLELQSVQGFRYLSAFRHFEREQFIDRARMNKYVVGEME